MRTAVFDQQPIVRTVGRREPQPVGRPPSPEARRAFAAMAAGRTRAPKGVFRYASHADMIRDRDAWTVEAIVARARG